MYLYDKLNMHAWLLPLREETDNAIDHDMYELGCQHARDDNQRVDKMVRQAEQIRLRALAAGDDGAARRATATGLVRRVRWLGGCSPAPSRRRRRRVTVCVVDLACRRRR